MIKVIEKLRQLFLIKQEKYHSKTTTAYVEHLEGVQDPRWPSGTERTSGNPTFCVLGQQRKSWGSHFNCYCKQLVQFFGQFNTTSDLKLPQLSDDPNYLILEPTTDQMGYLTYV